MSITQPDGRAPQELAKTLADLGRSVLAHRDTAAVAALARSEAKRNRALVLAQPDLAARLAQPPLSFTQPELWNGYVPVEQWRGLNNTNNPRRIALVALIREAELLERDADV